ncbi:hypothetical protein [Actinomadura hibisca]|uniref:hypothetical protein n=1 Tax=Actinomadura hibisca TaxID=68565 RepID=UPI000A89B33D|nr:hypothetical protein [Actinomadura hibisca]
MPALDTRRLAAKLDLSEWQLRLARENGLIPEPDAPEGRWSPEEAAAFADRAAQIRVTFGDRPPVGAVKAAAVLAARVGLDVERADVEILVAREDLDVVGSYRGHPLYLLHDLEALDPDVITEVVTVRKGPLLDTADAAGAARVLGWPKHVFESIAARRGLSVDKLGRYALGEVRALAGDTDLTAQVQEAERRAALAKARKEVDRHEESLRGWLEGCAAYVNRTADELPDLATARRALRSLAAARAAAAEHET